MQDDNLITQLKETARACLALAERLGERLDSVQSIETPYQPGPSKNSTEDSLLDGYPIEPPRC
jgi:hypothetical protein